MQKCCLKIVEQTACHHTGIGTASPYHDIVSLHRPDAIFQDPVFGIFFKKFAAAVGWAPENQKSWCLKTHT
jgi:hypothetical protein